MARVASARLVACGLTILGIVGGETLRAGGPAPEGRPRLELLARTLDGRRGRDVAIAPRVREELRSDALLLRSYEAPNLPPIWLFVDYHERQRLGATVHSPLVCYPGAGWTVEEAEDATLELDGEVRPVRWLDLRRDSEKMVALYWYETRWGRAARELALKTNVVRSALSRRASDAALVRLSTPVVGEDRESARMRLLGFVERADDELAAGLPFSTATPASSVASPAEEGP